MKQIPKKEIKGRYNVNLTSTQRKMLQRISEIENRSLSEVMGFAIEKLNELYK